MSQSITQESLFNLLRGLDHRINSLERILAHEIPHARVTGASQSVIDGPSQLAVFNNELEDFADMWKSAQPTRLTFTKSGVYLIVGTTNWINANNGHRIASLRLNSNDSILLSSSVEENATAFLEKRFPVLNVSARLEGDYVELLMQQFSGGPLGVVPFLSATWIGMNKLQVTEIIQEEP